MEINGQKQRLCQKEPQKMLETNGEHYEIEKYQKRNGV